jgi:hypothetical protein
LFIVVYKAATLEYMVCFSVAIILRGLSHLPPPKKKSEIFLLQQQNSRSDICLVRQNMNNSNDAYNTHKDICNKGSTSWMSKVCSSWSMLCKGTRDDRERLVRQHGEHGDEVIGLYMSQYSYADLFFTFVYCLF